MKQRMDSRHVPSGFAVNFVIGLISDKMDMQLFRPKLSSHTSRKSSFTSQRSLHFLDENVEMVNL